ncbi:MAG TPA: SagB/ThcOx family dehydrogenase [Kofleriaceae bacterium]|nr:SagB/ThcOx family dehydrogenase [Kofleriaceae bacterium]
MRRISWSIITAISLVAFHGCEVPSSQATPTRQQLPEPMLDKGPSLWNVLAMRRSARVFGSRALSEVEVGQLMWAAQGTTDGHRTAPSAGALYPLTIRMFDARGIWRYVPGEHALVHESPIDHRTELSLAALGQTYIRSAPVTFVITAETAITANKYGPRSAERFVAIEAGHVAQNVLLAATALDLAAVPVGAFRDDAMRKVLALPDQVSPLYLIAIGPRPSAP